jgi:hypothetical protein
MSQSIDLTDQTPVQIDTALADIYRRAEGHFADYLLADSRAKDYTRYADPSYRYYNAYSAKDYSAKAERYAAEAQQHFAAYEAALEETAPYDAEYNRRPWTRAWIVTSSEGHVHSTMACTTCNKRRQKRDGTWSAGTTFGWLPEVSGMDEAEIVDLAGEKACTVCYPSAPVESLGKPCRLDTAERKAEKAAKQAEKDAKTAERIAKGVTPDGRPLEVTWEYQGTRTVNIPLGGGMYRQEQEPKIWTGRKEIKTERAAEMWVVEQVAARRSEPSYDYADSAAVAVVVDALAAKRGTTPEALLASLEKKIVAKRKRGY